MRKILLIQTAFIGDVVLATALQEKMHAAYPETEIHWLVRQGNEVLFQQHPFVKKVWVWNKQKHKYLELFSLIRSIRKEQYDVVVNLQRFAATGLLTALSGAKSTIGFDKNPFSRFFTKSVAHQISGLQTVLHETDRNQLLIADFTDAIPARPRLYPTPAQYQKVASYQTEPYICLAPASVWFTKQFPIHQWVKLLEALPLNYSVYLLGAPGDRKLCDEIIRLAAVNTATNLCGLLSLLESAALQQGATMNYVNDSAPMHFASAMNAPVTAIYCSTLPEFGFGPLSQNSHIVETTETLTCRPCGLHGKMACPEKHFRCANSISIQQLLNTLPQ